MQFTVVYTKHSTKEVTVITVITAEWHLRYVQNRRELVQGAPIARLKAVRALPCGPNPHSILPVSHTASAPSDVLPAYSSYASQTYSWWSAYSSSVVSLAQECPIGWENAILMHPGGDMWLNDTIAFARCHAEAHTTVGSSLTELTAATTRSRVDVRSGSPTPKMDASSSVLSRAGPKMWMAIVIGFAAVAGNSI
ncbi:hypothetical protein O988_01682 [Pseudogymnoascus sp. VKM F-3808]|nr:hypothetical protein O988_01682 [Pseudogymnoascus sp. VKM F-3808]